MALTAIPSPAQPTRPLRLAPMTAGERMAGARTVIVLHGEADVSNRSVLCDMLCQVIALQVGDVVVDLGQVTVIDAAAVRALAMGHMVLDGQGRLLTFRSPSQLAARALDMFGLGDLIEVPREARRHERPGSDASRSGGHSVLCSYRPGFRLHTADARARLGLAEANRTGTRTANTPTSDPRGTHLFSPKARMHP
jgi:anti-anti-sigma factor